MEISSESFYEGYFSDFHRVKNYIYEDILADTQHYENRIFGKELLEKERVQFHRYIKADIRSNYFHSIETLFELIFAFEPAIHGEFNEDVILKVLSNSSWRKNSKRIKNIAKDHNELNFLNDIVKLSDRDYTFLEYLFYPAIDFSKNKDDLKGSLEAIKWGLRVLAKDLSDTAEYNNLKHGLRIINAVKTIAVFPKSTFDFEKFEGSNGHKFDMSNSFSFYQKEDDGSSEGIVTKLFETERDIEMTAFVSHLITNMIGIREAWKTKANKKEFNSFHVAFFRIEELKKAESSSSRMFFKVKKIKV